MINKITSRTNPEIQLVAALSDAKERHTQKRFIAEGARVIETMLNAGLKPHMIYATHNWLEQLLDQKIPVSIITQVSPDVMNKMSQATTPSGILAVFPINYGDIKKISGPGIVLAQIQDPGNAGTLMRTCVAMDKKNIIFVEGVDPWHPKVVQASAGAIAQLTIIRCSWQELIRHKKVPLAVLVVKNGKSLESAEQKNILLVIGGEAHGIHPNWLDACEEKYTLLMPGQAESLNAAVAGSIAMYILWSTVKE